MAETTGTAKPDSPSTDAHQFWGYLFKPNKCGTDLLNRLLAGIANYVASNFGPAEDCTDITPTQLAAFYKAVGGDYDILFLDTPASSIGFIYKSLGCLHSLQPAPDSDGYAIPSIPALKPKGFVTWQTIQLLLGPDEHVPFLRNSVAQFDIVDPATSKIFPKLLPKEAFPEKPDDDMLTWYENVSKRLRQEAERAAKAVEPPKSGVTSPRIEIVDSDGEEDFVPEDRTHAAAAAYFRNPLYRNREGRPTIIRRYTRVADYKTRTPREIVQDRGRVVANTLSKHFWTPWGKREEPRRRSPVAHRRSNSPFSNDVAGDFDDEDDDLDPTPTPHRHAHLHPHHSSHSRQISDPPPPKQPPRPRPQAFRRASSRSTRSLPSSESEDDGPQMAYTRSRSTRAHSQAYNQNVPLRHRRSHSPPGSPREYFPPFHEYTQHQHAQHSRRHSDKEKQNPAHHHASKVHSPHRHATSDPSRPQKDVRERYVERDWAHEAQNSPKRGEPADSPMAGSARPSPRESYMPAPPSVPSASNSAPPTPPPIKTFSGTNLSELAGGGHGPGQRTSGHGAHRRNQTHAPGASMMSSSSNSGQLPPGFRPTNGPLFATQVAHMHPTAPITPAAAGNAQPGVDPRVPAAANPPVPGGYYSPHAAPGPQPHAGGARRPSYPPRSERNTVAGPPPSRGQSLRYAGGSPWGSRNSSLERGSRERERERDRLAAAPHRYVPPGVAVGDGGGGVRRSYAGDSGWY